MKFKITRNRSLFKVENDYASLLKINDDGSLLFGFRYSISQSDAIKNNTTKVVVEVSTQPTKEVKVLKNSGAGNDDAKNIANNILLLSQNKQSEIDSYKKSIVAKQSSDITAFINNELVSKSTTKNVFKTKKKLKSVLINDLKAKNVNAPVLEYNAHESLPDVANHLSASYANSSSELSFQSILQYGVDPSELTSITKKSVSGTESFQGLLRETKSRVVSTNPLSKLHDMYVFSDTQINKSTNELSNDNDTQHVVLDESNDIIEIMVKVLLPKQVISDDIKQHFVRFSLRNGASAVAVDYVVKELDINNHINTFLTPKIPPIVKVVSSDISNKSNLEIMQKDQHADSVTIFRKFLSRIATTPEEYVNIGKFSLKFSDKSLLVPVDSSKQSATIYRVIPTIGDKLGFEYTNVVVRPKRLARIKGLSITTTTSTTGVAVLIQNIPNRVISIQIMRRNLSTRQQEFTTVGEPILIDDVYQATKSFSFVDQNVQRGHIYDYCANITFTSGLSELSGNSIIEYVPVQLGKVDTIIQNVDITYGFEPNVTFDIVTNVLDNNIDQIREMLKTLGIYDAFQEDVIKEREFVKGLIAHNIQRVNLTEGVREDFGVIIDSTFSDEKYRSINSVENLKPGHKYRYEIMTLIRAPETMFEKYKKEKIDPVTRKKYTFNPAKFLHPIALTDGILVTQQGFKTMYAKEQMQYGTVGLTQTVDVVFNGTSAKVINAFATLFDHDTNIVSWEIQGDVESVDHYVVFKEVHNIKTILGKVHSQFGSSVNFQHSLSSSDVGQMRYGIIPVYTNYKIGEFALTNSVVV